MALGNLWEMIRSTAQRSPSAVSVAPIPQTITGRIALCIPQTGAGSAKWTILIMKARSALNIADAGAGTVTWRTQTILAQRSDETQKGLNFLVRTRVSRVRPSKPNLFVLSRMRKLTKRLLH